MYYLIYKITNTINNKIYIGKHKTDNKNDGYFGSGLLLKRAIEKYGTGKFQKEILYECASEEEMNNREAEIVNAEFIARLDTYNIKNGGAGGFDYINRRGLNVNNLVMDLTNANIAKKECFRDPEWYAEFRQKVSNGLKLAEHNPRTFTGMKHSLESKQKISNAKRGTGTKNTNSQYGTCWITNTGMSPPINKKIKQHELDYWVKSGWTKGRTV